MKRTLFTVLLALIAATTTQAEAPKKPWDNGRLTVRGTYLVHENGTPFFWLGNTSWLMPERLNRDEVEFYLTRESEEGYNVEQIQVLDSNYPTFNVFGRQAFDDSFDFDAYTRPGEYGYWDHLDYIVDMAERMGIYIAMDCIWGGQVKRLTPEKAAKYGRFLAERYKNRPNIIWMIGGDIMGDKGMDAWESLARAIKAVDKVHLMTFHPRGRTTSAWWYNDREWLDFNMFQSGHRRYGQRGGDGDYTIRDNTEEDNWRYVAMSFGDKQEQIAGREVRGPQKPVIDGEPSYEDIPQGLHDFSAPRWQDYDVRRYAYWAVFAGCFGHTYGHNSIMQFMRPGVLGSFGAKKAWWDALEDPGYKQMKHLKRLMTSVPFTEGQCDQTVIASPNGERYDRIIATRGQDYLMVYNYSGRPMTLDLTKISGKKKKVWLMNPADGSLQYLGEYANAKADFALDGAYLRGSDRVVIATDSSKHYFDNWK
ncbi:MAG: glycoside hydrolase family 140 protein [Prevotella sp.]|nr:glycoside hydrolase family 140 protein [Prevotella sp.]MBR6320252.1 glycoside hydrolase family 140 protein [Prevotella sp.]